MNPPILPFKPLFPQKLKCQFKYTEFIGYASTSVWSYIFRANSIFDPNLSGTGYQPMWFDNMKAIYNSYCVLDSNTQIQIINQSASPARVCLSPQDTTSGLALSYQMQLPYASYATVGAGVSGNSLAYVQSRVNIARFTGFRDSEDVNLRSAVTTNPTTQVYWFYQAASVDATTLSQEIMWTVVYDVVLFDLVPTYDG